MDIADFPANFRWGAATASYQIEGAFDRDGRGTSIWDTFSKTPGKVANGDTGDVACDHFHRFRDDVAIMKELGLQSYRFSIAWPRLFPNGDKQRENRGFDFYNDLIDELLDAGIEPVATLYHWDLPQPLEDAGGWANRKIVEDFKYYAEQCVLAFGDRVKTWFTLNEPWVFGWLGYGAGVHAPGKQDRELGLASAYHTALTHGVATRAMRAIRPDLKIGIACNMTTYRVEDESDELQNQAKQLFDGHINRWWLDALTKGEFPHELVEIYGDRLEKLRQPGDAELLKVQTDLLGINYYSDSFITPPTDEDTSPSEGHVFPWDLRSGSKTPGPLTDMGWPITPDGLFELLVRISQDWPEIPELVISENGAAYGDQPDENGLVHDARRESYLKQHVEAVGRAISSGAPVTHYLHWSLLDNFEWAEGYEKRFGLVHVDFETQQRTIKESAKTYASIIAEHSKRGVGVGR